MDYPGPLLCFLTLLDITGRDSIHSGEASLNINLFQIQLIITLSSSCDETFPDGSSRMFWWLLSSHPHIQTEQKYVDTYPWPTCAFWTFHSLL